jgi:short-subunit dehydrogenase
LLLRLRFIVNKGEITMIKKHIALITGASGGLGRELAIALRRHDKDLECWLTGRSLDKLKKTADYIGNSRCFVLDLSDPVWSEKWRQILQKEQPDITWLINNAGFGYTGPFRKESATQIQSMAEVDFSAPVRLSSLCLPYMDKGSHILNVSSVAAFLPLPQMALYSAVKAGLLQFSLALAEELKPQGITVTALCPYWIGDTGFISHLSPNTPINLTGSLTAKDVARCAISGALQGKTMVTPGFLATFIRAGCTVLPQSILLKIRRFWKA